MFKKIIKIIKTIFISIFLLVVALILLFLFGYRTEVSYASPVWSKDGSRIYYVKNVEYWKTTLLSMVAAGVGGNGGKYTFKQKSYIMSIRPDGSNKKVITKFITKKNDISDNITNEYPAYIVNLKLLPKSDEIVFFIKAMTGYKDWIYKVRTDGTNLVKLLDLGEVTKPSELFVSPDGTKIAYTKERYHPEDSIGSVFSSWLIDADGKNNHMICREESNVKGWTTDGKLIISAYADSEGNAKLEYDNKANRIVYPNDVTYRILIYDPTSKKFIKNLPGFSFEEKKEELKNLGFIKYDPTTSPDGNKRLLSWDDGSIGIIDIDGKNEKILHKGKK